MLVRVTKFCNRVISFDRFATCSLFCTLNLISIPCDGKLWLNDESADEVLEPLFVFDMMPPIAFCAQFYKSQKMTRNATGCNCAAHNFRAKFLINKVGFSIQLAC